MKEGKHAHAHWTSQRSLSASGPISAVWSGCVARRRPRPTIDQPLLYMDRGSACIATGGVKALEIEPMLLSGVTVE